MAHVELEGLFKLGSRRMEDVQQAVIEFLDREGMSYKFRGTEIEARQGSTVLSWLFLLWFAPWSILPKKALIVGDAGSEPGDVSAIRVHIEDHVFALELPPIMIRRYQGNFFSWMQRLAITLGVPVQFDSFAAFERVTVVDSLSQVQQVLREEYEQGVQSDDQAYPEAQQLYEQGGQHLRNREWKKSIEAFDRCLAILGPTSPGDNARSTGTRAGAYRNRALAYDGLSEELTKDSPGFSDLLLAIDAAKQAVADYDESIRLEPQLAITHSDRGKCLTSLGQYQLGARKFRDARESFQQALVSLQRAIELNSSLMLAYYNRALLGALVGNREQSKEDFETAVSLGANAEELAAKLKAAQLES